MTSNQIVLLLRNAAKSALEFAPDHIVDSLYWAAADEIERLTAVNAELLKSVNEDEGYAGIAHDFETLKTQHEALKRENARLRNLLICDYCGKEMRGVCSGAHNNDE